MNPGVFLYKSLPLDSHSFLTAVAQKVNMIRCIIFFLIATLANGEPVNDPMQKFWWPKNCSDGWRGATESSTAGPQCCNTLAPTDTPIGRPCVFPFKYKDVEYNACTYVESEWLWCATEVTEDGDMVPNRYIIYI